jgi:hypothetical protein
LLTPSSSSTNGRELDGSPEHQDAGERLILSERFDLRQAGRGRSEDLDLRVGGIALAESLGDDLARIAPEPGQGGVGPEPRDEHFRHGRRLQ